jgi:hypothetical protein
MVHADKENGTPKLIRVPFLFDTIMDVAAAVVASWDEGAALANGYESLNDDAPGVACAFCVAVAAAVVAFSVPKLQTLPL